MIKRMCDHIVDGDTSVFIFCENIAKNLFTASWYDHESEDSEHPEVITVKYYACNEHYIQIMTYAYEVGYTYSKLNTPPFDKFSVIAEGNI